MIRSAPQLISLAAVAVGVLLLALTLARLDLQQTVDSITRLGVAFPVLLLPGVAWHLLRTWGWSIAFPADARPAFTRLFRVRLAADAVSFFTVRGITSEPLRVMLLCDRVAPPVAAASMALERLAFAVVSLVIAGLVSYFAVRSLPMSGAWTAVFSLVSIIAVLGIAGLVQLARHRTGDVLGGLVTRIGRRTGRQLESSNVVRFILDVERVMLDLLRGDRRRLVILSVLPVVCYLITTFEVWLVLWSVGEPAGLTAALAIETFARLGSVASAAIPANLGALEASNAMPVAMLGLGGGGVLAFVRRLRALVWAALGLALYPRISTPLRAAAGAGDGPPPPHVN